MTGRATSVYVPVDGNAIAEFHRYGHRAPILVIRCGHPAAWITLTLPERVEAGHVEFARALARSAARYAIEVERCWRGLPCLPAPWPRMATRKKAASAA